MRQIRKYAVRISASKGHIKFVAIKFAIINPMDIKKTVIPVLKKYGVRKAFLFGWYARGDFDQNSDIDLLINI